MFYLECAVCCIFHISFSFLQGFVPLYQSWESFYTRNVYRRIRDCWNRVVASKPGTCITILDRHSCDHGWTFEYVIWPLIPRLPYILFTYTKSPHNFPTIKFEEENLRYFALLLARFWLSPANESYSLVFNLHTVYFISLRYIYYAGAI